MTATLPRPRTGLSRAVSGVAAGALASIALVSIPTTAHAADEVATPSVVVSRTTVQPDGSTAVTVTGIGFDPDLATATRPPLAGGSGGVYVTFGKFADTWKPSAAAPPTARKSSDVKWAVPAANIDAVGGATAGAIELTPDGSFAAELTIDKSAIDKLVAAADDPTSLVNYGIYTYPGGGASQPLFETYTPITFATTTTTRVAVTSKAAYGNAATATATVTGSTTGTVAFFDGAKSLGTAAVSAGKATKALPANLAPGAHSITATFLGTETVLTSTSAAARLTVVKAGTSTAVKVTRKPTSKKVGKATVTVKTKARSQTPTGKATVTLKKGKSVKKVKAKVLKNGKVVFTLPKLRKGTWKATVSYRGAKTHTASTKVVKIKVSK